MIFRDEKLEFHLVWGHASEAEHADLVSDVTPVPNGSFLGKVFLQLGTHVNDSVSHALDILQPNRTVKSGGKKCYDFLFSKRKLIYTLYTFKSNSQWIIL